MTDDALPPDTDEGLREAYELVLELKREIEEIREDFSRFERKARRADESDRLTISLM